MPRIAIAVLLIPRELPAAPMMLFAIWIKHVLNVAVQCSHDADPREHRRPARCRDQDQSLHCRLPLRGLVLGLRELDYVIASLLEGDKAPAARQRYRIFETSLPTMASHRHRSATASA